MLLFSQFSHSACLEDFAIFLRLFYHIHASVANDTTVLDGLYDIVNT